MSHRIFNVALLLLIVLPVSAEPTLSENNKIFVINGGASANPVGMIKSKSFANFEISAETQSEDCSRKMIDSKEILSGQTAYVYQNGRFKEKTTISTIYIDPQDGCTEGDHIEFDQKSKLDSMQYGIVTTAPLSVRPALPPRNATKSEIAAAHELAGKLLLSKHVLPQHILSLQKNLKITPTNLRNNGQYALVIEGQYSYETKVKVIRGNAHEEDSESRIITLFLVAELGSHGTYELKYTQVYDGDEGETADMGSTMIDHIDLDGDGVDEIVFQYNGYEWWGYSILKWTTKGWKIALQQAGGGC